MYNNGHERFGFDRMSISEISSVQKSEGKFFIFLD